MSAILKSLHESSHIMSAILKSFAYIKSYYECNIKKFA